MKITKRQLRRIIRETGRPEHDAEARGMVASYRQGYNDAYRGPGYKKRGNREYLRGYQQGVADVEQGKPPPDGFRPARRIREAEGSTKKYDDDSALKGGQSKLPDALQKGIIDKTVDDREEREEEEREEKNESVQIIKRQLRRTIREMMRGPAAEMAAAAAETGAAGMAHRRDGLGKNITDVDFPIIVGYEGKSEIAYNQDELDDILDYVAPTHGSSGIPYSLDSISDLEPHSVPVGVGIEQLSAGKKIKITKSHLKRIIQETVLRENLNSAIEKALTMSDTKSINVVIEKVKEIVGDQYNDEQIAIAVEDSFDNAMGI